MHAFESHRQWPAVKQVCDSLRAEGHQAWLAGGCVRDLIMNREPNDFDVATDAKPESVEKLFANAITVGREFGVTIVPFDGFQVEIATFRQDGPYEDGRRPTHVVFSTPEEDAKRRDFTVNALYFDVDKKKVVDFVGGEADIRAKTLRAVGDPDKRFDEDKLRILRAVRFAAQLDFQIEAKTLEAVRKRHAQIAVVAHERIRDEILKLMKSPNSPLGLGHLRQTGLWQVIFPELGAILKDPVLQLAIDSRAFAGASRPALAALILMYDFVLVNEAVHLPMAENVLKRLRFSSTESEAFSWCCKNREYFLRPQK